MHRLILSSVFLLSAVGAVMAVGRSTESRASVARVDGCQIILADERDLATGQSGIVSAIHVREGDPVQAGMLIADLDSTVQQATLAVAAKEADNDVSVRFAIAAARVARIEYRRAVEANRIVRDAVPEIEVEKLKLEMERSVLEIEVSEHELAVSGLRRDEAGALVNSYRIESPMNGVISRVFKSPGESMQMGEALLQCRQTDIVHVSADVDINLLKSLQKGRTVTVIPTTPNPAVDRPESPLEGTVFYVSAAVDPVSRLTRVLVEVPNPDGLLLAGTYASLEWDTAAVPNRPVTARRNQD